ncbi:hypothetical protein BTI_4140 [Burkholderia thailandensis MSMB121]|nr:hypothetical protein BTI_4140 [Burkholderia thailandensis MSMB121]
MQFQTPEGLRDLADSGPVRKRKNILRMAQEERDLFVEAVPALKNNINNRLTMRWQRCT